MRAIFQLFGPKIGITDNYLKDIALNLSNNFSYPVSHQAIAHEGVENDVYQINTYQFKEHFSVLSSATLQIFERGKEPTLEVQVTNTFQPKGNLSLEEVLKFNNVIVAEELNFHKVSYDLKVAIKEQLINDWEKCIWIFDMDSTILSKELYSQIYDTENSVRHFINMVLMDKKGIQWWDSYIQSDILKKSNKRLVGYQSIAPLFKDVDINLLSIDVSDLSKILKMKSSFSRNRATISNSIETQTDFWYEVFSHYFDTKITVLLDQFSRNRNHIAHNKLIDLNAYQQILINIKEVNEELNNARDKYFKSK